MNLIFSNSSVMNSTFSNSSVSSGSGYSWDLSSGFWLLLFFVIGVLGPSLHALVTYVRLIGLASDDKEC